LPFQRHKPGSQPGCGLSLESSRKPVLDHFGQSEERILGKRKGRETVLVSLDDRGRLGEHRAIVEGLHIINVICDNSARVFFGRFTNLCAMAEKRTVAKVHDDAVIDANTLRRHPVELVVELRAQNLNLVAHDVLFLPAV